MLIALGALRPLDKEICPALGSRVGTFTCSPIDSHSSLTKEMLSVPLHQFPRVAVTEQHRLGDLKQ